MNSNSVSNAHNNSTQAAANFIAAQTQVAADSIAAPVRPVVVRGGYAPRRQNGSSAQGRSSSSASYVTVSSAQGRSSSGASILPQGRSSSGASVVSVLPQERSSLSASVVPPRSNIRGGHPPKRAVTDSEGFVTVPVRILNSSDLPTVDIRIEGELFPFPQYPDGNICIVTQFGEQSRCPEWFKIAILPPHLRGITTNSCLHSHKTANGDPMGDTVCVFYLKSLFPRQKGAPCKDGDKCKRLHLVLPNHAALKPKSVAAPVDVCTAPAQVANFTNYSHAIKSAQECVKLTDQVAPVDETKGEKIARTNKTRICKHWAATGRCPYTGICDFAHGLEELLSGSVAFDESEVLIKNGTFPFHKVAQLIHDVLSSVSALKDIDFLRRRNSTLLDRTQGNQFEYFNDVISSLRTSTCLDTDITKMWLLWGLVARVSRGTNYSNKFFLEGGAISPLEEMVLEVVRQMDACKTHKKEIIARSSLISGLDVPRWCENMWSFDKKCICQGGNKTCHHGAHEFFDINPVFGVPMKFRTATQIETDIGYIRLSALLVVNTSKYTANARAIIAAKSRLRLIDWTLLHISRQAKLTGFKLVGNCTTSATLREIGGIKQRLVKLLANPDWEKKKNEQPGLKELKAERALLFAKLYTGNNSITINLCEKYGYTPAPLFFKKADGTTTTRPCNALASRVLFNSGDSFAYKEEEKLTWAIVLYDPNRGRAWSRFVAAAPPSFAQVTKVVVQLAIAQPVAKKTVAPTVAKPVLPTVVPVAPAVVPVAPAVAPAVVPAVVPVAPAVVSVVCPFSGDDLVFGVDAVILEESLPEVSCTAFSMEAYLKSLPTEKSSRTKQPPTPSKSSLKKQVKPVKEDDEEDLENARIVAKKHREWLSNEAKRLGITVEEVKQRNAPKQKVKAEPVVKLTGAALKAVAKEKQRQAKELIAEKEMEAKATASAKAVENQKREALRTACTVAHRKNMLPAGLTTGQVNEWQAAEKLRLTSENIVHKPKSQKSKAHVKSIPKEQLAPSKPKRKVEEEDDEEDVVKAPIAVAKVVNSVPRKNILSVQGGTIVFPGRDWETNIESSDSDD